MRTTRELLQQALQNPDLIANGGPDLLRSLATVDGAVRKRELSEQKAASRYDAAQVHATVRAISQLWCEKTGTHLAPTAAARIHALLLATFNINLREHNSAALDLLTAEIQAAANETIQAVQREAEDRCAGYRQLDLTGEPAP